MKNIVLTLLAGGLALLGGCGDSASGGRSMDTFGACTGSLQCPAGQVCENGSCVWPLDCGSSDCVAVYETCADSPFGCECRLAHSAGPLAAGEAAKIFVEGGQLAHIEPVLHLVDGQRLPTVAYTVDIAPSNSFLIEHDTVRATEVPGKSTLWVSFGSLATCVAEVMNVGAVPSDGRARIVVTDALTGAPVQGAHIVVDATQDGLDDGDAPATDHLGTALTGQPVSGPVTISVFAAGYHYLSVMAAEPAGEALFLPLQPMGATAAVAGASGSVDFSPYRNQHRDGISGSLQISLTAASFDVARLAAFDMTTLFGNALNSGDCTSGVHSAGCYEVNLPGLVNDTLPLWGGLVIELPNQSLKGHFDVLATPGMRSLWTVGGEFSLTQAMPVLKALLATSPSSCACDVTPNACDAQCACDADCGGSMSALMRALMPLLAQSALDVRASVPFAPTDRAQWMEYIQDPLSQRGPQSTFPVFDDNVGERSSISLRRPLAQFTAMKVPSLPMDPRSDDGSTMEGYVALAGAIEAGGGFVPLGFGMAFDCTGSECQGAPSRPWLYDGLVNDQWMCTDGANCPVGIPAKVSAGQVGMVHTSLPFQLQEAATRTVLLATPVESWRRDHIAVAGVIREGLPTGHNADWTDAQFPAYPQSGWQAEREYVLHGSSGSSVHVLRLYRAETAAGSAPEWLVYGAPGKHFVAPVVPAGFADPLDSVEAPPRAHHAVLKLVEGVDLHDFLHLGYAHLGQLFTHATGFAASTF